MITRFLCFVYGLPSQIRTYFMKRKEPKSIDKGAAGGVQPIDFHVPDNANVWGSTDVRHNLPDGTTPKWVVLLDEIELHEYYVVAEVLKEHIPDYRKWYSKAFACASEEVYEIIDVAIYQYFKEHLEEQLQKLKPIIDAKLGRNPNTN